MADAAALQSEPRLTLGAHIDFDSALKAIADLCERLSLKNSDLRLCSQGGRAASRARANVPVQSGAAGAPGPGAPGAPGMAGNDADTSLKPVVVDLSGLRQFDSSVLTVLLELKRRMRDQGYCLVVENTPENLLDLAKLYGLCELIGCPEPGAGPDAGPHAGPRTASGPAGR